MGPVLRHPGAFRLLATSIVARIPLAGVGVLLIVHAHALTGSYAVAGLVAAAQGLATAAAAPLLGRVVDRRGQTLVLVASGLASAAALTAAALLPRAAPAAALVVLAALAGATTPPLGACLRTLWTAVLPTPDLVSRAYAMEAALLELTYISGPLTFLGLAAAWSSRASLALLAALLGAGTLAFAAQPASRRWAPAGAHATGRGGALRSPGVRTLVAVIALLGALLGATEVAVPAVAGAAGTAAATGPLLALWGVGSLVGGIAAARNGGVRGVAGMVAALVALAATHAALAAAGSSLGLLALLLLVAGLGIAPLFAVTYALVGDVAPAGTVTEAFAWMTTAIAAGVAAGSAAAGAVVDASGTGWAFLLAGAAAGLGALVAALRAPTLTPAVPSATCGPGPTAASSSPSAGAAATR